MGFSILDLSKLLMHEFHYKHIKRIFSANLLFTDTDSLVYKIKTDDVYKDFNEDKNLFDLRDYPQDSKFFDPVKKLLIKGKWIQRKDNEFVALKSKICSLMAVDNREVNKIQGSIKMLLKA